MRKFTGKIALTAASLGLLASPIAAEDVAVQDKPGGQLTLASASINEANARLAVVQAHIDAYRSGNLDRFVATFTKDAVVRADGFVAIGHKQIRALYALNFEPGAPTLRVHDSGVSAEAVQVSIGYVFADGQEMCCSVSTYEVTGGKVSFLEAGL